MPTIGDFSPPASLDGTEKFAAWKDGADAGILLSQILDLALQRTTSAVSSLSSRARNSVPFPSWTALSGAVGMAGSDRATVSVSDTGNHIDAVLNVSVTNAGVYTYNATAQSWQWVSALDSTISQGILASTSALAVAVATNAFNVAQATGQVLSAQTDVATKATQVAANKAASDANAASTASYAATVASQITLAMAASGITRAPFDSYASAIAAVASINMNEPVAVLVDENVGRTASYYRKTGTSTLTYIGSLGRGRSSSEYFLRDFKIPSDADYSMALVRFCLGKDLNGATGARADSASGRGVRLNLPTDEVINYNSQTAFAAFGGIRNLHVKGKTKFINTATGYASPMDLFGRCLINDGAKRRKIRSARKNQDTVYIIDYSGDTSLFYVGEWVLVAYLDIQYSGYPPNSQFFEFKQIKALGAGWVQFTTGLRYDYKQSWPVSPTSSYPMLGPASICKLDTVSAPDSRVCANSAYFPWDIDVTLEGLDIPLPPNASTVQPYITTIGRKFLWRECSVPGTSESLTQMHIFEGGSITSISEPDKFNGSSIYDRVTCTGGLVFQSASQEFVDIRGGSYGYLQFGGAKYAKATSCNIGGFSDSVAGSIYGHAKNHVLDNVVCHNAVARFEDQVVASRGVAVDGTNVIYANGVISVPLSQFYNFGATLSPVPGEVVALADSSGNFRRGYQGQIKDVGADSSFFYIYTDINADTMPTGASRFLRFSGSRLSVRDSSGCGAIVRASKANLKGLSPELRYDYTLSGAQSVTSGTWTAGRGVIKELRINVIKPATMGGSPRFMMDIPGVDPDTFAGGVSALRYTIDTSVVGERVLTSTGFGTTPKPNDTFTQDGSNVTVLPDKWSNGMTWSVLGYTPSSGNARKCPHIEITLIYDIGLIGRDMGQVVDDTLVNINSASVDGPTLTVTGSVSGTRNNILIGDSITGPGLDADTVITGGTSPNYTISPPALTPSSGAYVIEAISTIGTPTGISVQ